MTVSEQRATLSCPKSCVQRDSVNLTVGTEGRMAYGKSSLKHYNRIFHQNAGTWSGLLRTREGVEEALKLWAQKQLLLPKFLTLKP